MPANEHVAALERIFAAIHLVSPHAFSCAGLEFETKSGPLMDYLADFLYHQCFISPFRGDPMGAEVSSDPEDDLVEQLRKAHCGLPCRDSGWRVEQALDTGQILARKDGALRLFEPGFYLVHEGPGGPPQEGQRVTICFPKDSVTAQPSFYFAFGETVSEHEEGYNLVRFYWNLSAEGTAPMMAALIPALNRFQVPFQLKCARFRPMYYRLDAAVLYVSKRHYSITAMLAADVHGAVRDYLSPETPLFTKRLADGLALAEDPGGSFGLSRCRIVAQALWAAFEKNSRTEEERLEEVEGQFQAAGLDWEHPYLGPDSADCYEFGPHELGIS